MENLVEVPETEPQERELQTVAQMATGLVISDKATHGRGQELLRALAAIERNVIDLFAAPKAAAHHAHKVVCAAEKKLLDEVQVPRRQLSHAIGNYEFQERVKAEAERKRLEAEAKAKAEAEAQALAEQLEAAGDKEQAEEVIQEAIAAPAPVVHVAPEVAKTEGVSSRTNYSAEVTDLQALIVHVAAHLDQANLLAPNMPALNAYARSMRDNMNVPGVRLVRSVSHAVRREQ